ncbi:hypothetical protein P4V74_08790 [Bacillus thuringiensis]|nr:hypothetical protein [Bacillus thuringiensis]
MDEKRKMTKYDYWVSYVFKRNSGSNSEHGNDHINIAEEYSGIEWIREIEGRICKKYKFKSVKILNFVPLFNEEMKVEPQIDIDNVITQIRGAAVACDRMKKEFEEGDLESLGFYKGKSEAFRCAELLLVSLQLDSTLSKFK